LPANASREKLIAGLRAFADEADWAVVYYAGHGIEVNGQNYLIPVDAVLKTDRDIQFEAIPLDQVMASIDGAKKLKLVILDACRDNPFAPQIKKTTAPDAVTATSTAGGNVGTRSIGRGLGEVKVQGASLVVFAAKHGQTALDGEGGNSPFAVAMVQRVATPGVEINKIFRSVRDDVMEATGGAPGAVYLRLAARQRGFLLRRGQIAGLRCFLRPAQPKILHGKFLRRTSFRRDAHACVGVAQCAGCAMLAGHCSAIGYVNIICAESIIWRRLCIDGLRCAALPRG
jgi:uncharacterized caspase-like protein